jgi:hypothetical protein
VHQGTPTAVQIGLNRFVLNPCPSVKSVVKNLNVFAHSLFLVGDGQAG